MGALTMTTDYRCCTFKSDMSSFVTLNAVRGDDDIHLYIVESPWHSLLSALVTPGCKYWLELRVAQHLTHVLLIQRAPLPVVTVGDNVTLTPTSHTQLKLNELVPELSKHWSPNVLLCSTFFALTRSIRIYRFSLLKSRRSTRSTLFSGNGIILSDTDTVIDI